MRVAAVQFKARPGDLTGSRRALSVLATAAAQQSDLVVLPELAVSGYSFADRAAADGVAEAPRGATFAALSPVAREAHAWLVAGYVERAADALFNSAMVIDPHGELAFSYRKTLLFEADQRWASPGDSGYRAFDTDAGRFGVGICMDINDDRFVSWLRREDVDAVAFPTNWVAEEMPVWPYWAWRLLDVRAALIAADSYGPDGDFILAGQSAVLRSGAVLAGTGPDGDAIVRAVL